jgi:hypothetical protein
MFSDRKDSILYSIETAAKKSPAGMLWAITREASADNPTALPGEEDEDEVDYEYDDDDDNEYDNNDDEYDNDDDE